MKTHIQFCFVALVLVFGFNSSKAYSIATTPPGSNNASLKTISISTGSVLTNTPGTTNYVTSVSAGTASLTLTPTTVDVNATVTVNGTSVTSGTASQVIILNAGPTTINLLVTAQNGVTTKAYSITVNKNGSTNASLKTISLSTGSVLTNTPGTNTYTTSVNAGVASLTVTPTTIDANATVTVNGTPVTSGTASQVINLNPGSTTINLVVTAQDGFTTKAYSITVNRNGSTNAFLKTVTVSTGSILTNTPGTNTYTTSVAAGTASLTVTPTTADVNATVTVNGTPVVSGTASQVINLNAGPTTINLVVTAQDGFTKKTYSITVNKNGSTNASLSTLSLSTGSALTTVGGPSNVNYSAIVPAGTASLTVTPTTADVNATVTVNGAPVVSGTPSQVINLNASGSTVINLLVTAQDGVTTKSYQITVTKAQLTDYNWTGAGGNTNWSNNNNWSPSTGHPVAGNTVSIDVTANKPNVDVASACASIVINGSTALTLSAPLTISNGITLNAQLATSGPGNLTTKALTISAGALTNSSTINVTNGNINLVAGTTITNQVGGILNSNGVSVINMLGNSTILNAGAINIGNTIIRLGGTGNITNNNGATFTIDGNSSIDFATNTATNAYISNAGTFYAGTSTSACAINLNYQGVSVQNTGTFYLGSSSIINLTGSGSFLGNTGTFTLQSDSTGSATIGNITGAGAGCFGTYSVERYISGGSSIYRSYRLLSSPVYTSTTGGNNIYSLNYVKLSSLITGTGGTAGGFDRAGNPSLYLYRDNIAASNISFTSGNFRGISDISAAPAYSIDVDGGSFHIPVANGFMFFFRGDRVNNLANKFSPGTVAESVTLTATGTLNTGPITVKQWFTPSSSTLDYTPVTGNSNVVGFTLTGNPYPSSIDWDTYNINSSTTGIYAPNVSSNMYILDPVSRNYSVYIAGSGGIGTIATADANVIPSGQGFFVQASNSSAQLIFNESAKINKQVSKANHNLFLGAPPVGFAVKQYLHLKLQKDALNTDGAIINFNSSANAKYVFNEDAPYKMGNGAVSLSTFSEDNVPLAVNTLALPKQSKTTISLNVNGDTDGLYKLNLASVKGIPDLYDVWLMDAYKKDSMDIKHNPTYLFNIYKNDPTSFGPIRFSLVIRQNTALGMRLLDFSAAKTTNGAQILWKTENEQNYTNFTVERSINNGKTFDVLDGFASSAQGTYSLLDKTVALNTNNQYRLKLEDLNGTISYSKIVTLMYSNSTNALAKGSISIYPNPAVGAINLSIGQEVNNGSYGIQIVSNTGTVVKTATVNQSSWHDDVSGLLPGTYIINVVNYKDKSVVGQSRFVKL